MRDRALRDERTEIRSAIRQGKIEGKIEGQREGQAALLERLLTRRFGPLREEDRARLEAATLEQLEQWSDRMLDATTIEAVFSGQ